MDEIKDSDIDMMEQDGFFQLAIKQSCVTGYKFKTSDDCYKSYIVRLINSIERAKELLGSDVGF